MRVGPWKDEGEATGMSSYLVCNCGNLVIGNHPALSSDQIFGIWQHLLGWQLPTGEGGGADLEAVRES